MRIHIQIDNQTIEIAAHLLAKYYNSYKFLEQLRTVKSFNYTSATGNDVAESLKNANIDIYIVGYKPWNRWSRVIGHAKLDRRTKTVTISCNLYKLNLPLLARVNNFMHESLHGLGYSHKGNTNNEFNRGTIPYKVGKLFEEFVKKEMEA